MVFVHKLLRIDSDTTVHFIALEEKQIFFVLDTYMITLMNDIELYMIHLSPINFLYNSKDMNLQLNNHYQIDHKFNHYQYQVNINMFQNQYHSMFKEYIVIY